MKKAIKMHDSIYALIGRDAHGSVLYMVLGGLLMLSAFHLAMYLRNREKCYLLYSSYTFFSFLAYMPVVEGGFLENLSASLGFDAYSKSLFIIVFNCFYFFFFAEFLNIRSASERWYRITVYPVIILLGIAIFTFFQQKYFGGNYFNIYKKLFVILITIQTIISFYILTKIKNNLKYYIIFGGLILFICSVMGETAVRELPWINITPETGNLIYFAGLLVENLAFSFALGHKQRVIFEQKVAYHQDFVIALKKNEHLKDQVSRENETRLTIENEKIKYLQEISDLKLSVLQSQMNPHFIFNALNSIKYCILQNDNENAVNYLTKFSKILRTILAASKMKEFTLSQELHTLQLYVDIENLRFTDINFTINTAPDVDLEKVKLPPMVLQPFIENAILHGVALVDDKKINLEVFDEGEYLKIIITDNGIGREKAGKLKSAKYNSTKSLGVEIARGMLKSYFAPQHFSVQYIDREENNIPAGTQVVITIPKP